MSITQIKNLKGTVLLTYSSEDSTLIKTLERAVRDGIDLTGATYTKDQIISAFADETTIF